MAAALLYAEGEIARAEAEELLCVVCAQPLIAPLVHAPCGNMACRACLDARTQCSHCHGRLVPAELQPVALRLILSK